MRKSYGLIVEKYYGITEADVGWVIQRCSNGTLQVLDNARSIPSLILTPNVFERVQIDLVDMRSKACGKWKWILTVKNVHSGYVWTWPLENKSSAEVAERMDLWLRMKAAHCTCKPDFLFVGASLESLLRKLNAATMLDIV